MNGLIKYSKKMLLQLITNKSWTWYFASNREKAEIIVQSLGSVNTKLGMTEGFSTTVSQSVSVVRENVIRSYAIKTIGHTILDSWKMWSWLVDTMQGGKSQFD